MPDHTNRLAAEKSPYLLQHAHNPVDWYPWGDEAFERARRDDKPVILSVGYSTCHWCHVMEEESFSDPEIAQVMNRHFVSVKVDREERPDIDAVYMNYVMASTGSGGWPMTVLLTPDKKPFYGGTYFPPKDRMGMPGFQTLLLSAADAWRTRRSELIQSADTATRHLEKHEVAGEPAELGVDTLENAFLRYEESFDAENGGFGGAPKFPRSHALSFLFRHWRRTGVAKALSMAETTLRKMDNGGMHDALGGGFHRYSTDAYWRVPHFEKMLYDQALLARTYAEAYQITKNERYRRVTRDILDYVLREMVASEGGFFSAQDADSVDAEGRKREGAFYVWRKKDIQDTLGVSEADIFCFHYGVEENGNALNDPHKELEGQNTLYVAHSLEETAARFDRSAAQIAKSLGSSRATLRELRSKRPAPYLDDKILADWNGLMIAAFAFASRVFEDAVYRDAAAHAAGFVLSAMKDKKGRLFHRYRQGDAAITGNLNDHAFMVYGLLALYEASFDPRWLEAACGIADRMIEFFGDDAAGGFFLTAKDAETLIARPKEIYDGAVPSGNSMAALVLAQLYAFTGREKYSAAADATLKAFSSQLSTDASNYPQMLMALDFVLGPSSEVVIVEGDPTELGDDMTRAIYSRFNPNQVVLRKGAGAAAAALENLAPFTAGQKPIGGITTAFFCRRHACTLPVTDAAALAVRLDSEMPSTVKKGGSP